MANQITDNRTLLWDAGDGTGGAPDDLTGSALSNTDTSTFIEGSTSYALSITNSVLGQLFDAGSAQDYSNQTFHLWVNCGVVGLLLTKANGGLTVRFCGATVTDWFEINVGGSDSWPVTFEGGWAVFVVDIEDAFTNSDTTNGTKPNTNAIRFVGMTATTTIMPKMADNFWMDAIFRNPTADPAWIVEGRNGGSTDWTFADVATELGVASGLVIPIDGGSFYVTGPGQFGINDTTTHGFESVDDIILWADQEFVLDGYYKLSAIGNSGGTTRVILGASTGSGDSEVGSRGATISSGVTNARWDVDFNDPDLDQIDLHGCTFKHGGDFLLDDIAVSVISTAYIDCSSALVTGGQQLRVSVIDANTADGVAFMTTDDLTDIVFSAFEFSDGHAVELATPRVATQASKGNVFTGYGITTSNDAAVYNNTAGAVTINVTDNGSDITYRDGTSASTTIVLNPVSLTLHVIRLDTGGNLQNARAFITVGATGPFPYQASVTITQSGGTATVAHTAHGLVTGDKVFIEGVTNDEDYNGVNTITVTTANAYEYTVASGAPSPATGTITSTLALISGLTDSGGLITDTRTYSADSDFEGRVRDSTTPSPFYRTSPVSGTLDKDIGLTVQVGMIRDD